MINKNAIIILAILFIALASAIAYTKIGSGELYDSIYEKLGANNVSEINENQSVYFYSEENGNITTYKAVVLTKGQGTFRSEIISEWEETQ